eukprot:g33871.t1
MGGGTRAELCLDLDLSSYWLKVASLFGNRPVGQRIREWVAERGGSQERCIRLNLSTITRGPAAATDHLAYASPRPNNNY